MTAEEGKQRIREIEALKTLWKNLLPSIKVPSDSEFGWWLCLDDFEVVWRGIEKTARKNMRTGFESDSHAIKFTSAVLSSIMRRQIYVGEQNERRQKDRTAKSKLRRKLTDSFATWESPDFRNPKILNVA
jgi:hypothetical protein